MDDGFSFVVNRQGRANSLEYPSDTWNSIYFSKRGCLKLNIYEFYFGEIWQPAASIKFGDYNSLPLSNDFMFKKGEHSFRSAHENNLSYIVLKEEATLKVVKRYRRI